MWVEQSYKQVKHVLGWSDYQIRSDIAKRRHWQLVCCAFSFCWWAYGHLPTEEPTETEDTPATMEIQVEESSSMSVNNKLLLQRFSVWLTHT